MEEVLLVPDSEGPGECLFLNLRSSQETVKIDGNRSYPGGTVNVELLDRSESTKFLNIGTENQGAYSKPPYCRRKDGLDCSGSERSVNTRTQGVFDETVKLGSDLPYVGRTVDLDELLPVGDSKDVTKRYRSPSSVRIAALRKSAANAIARLALGKDRECMDETGAMCVRDMEICDFQKEREEEISNNCLINCSGIAQQFEKIVQVVEEPQKNVEEWRLFRGSFLQNNEETAPEEEEEIFNTQMAVETIHFMKRTEPSNAKTPDGKISNDTETENLEVTPNIYKRAMEENPEVTSRIDKREMEASPHNTSTASKRRRTSVNYRILFSHGLPDAVVKRQTKLLQKLGGQVVYKVANCTHFVSGEAFTRSINMLEAMASGKPVVTPSWLESSSVAGCFLKETNYLLRDSKKERELGFSMSSTLTAAQQRPLLQGIKVHVTPNTSPPKEAILSIIKAAGGTVAGNRTKDITFAISCDQDQKLCGPLIKKGVKVYSAELLLHGIVAYKLELSKFHLFD